MRPGPISGHCSTQINQVESDSELNDILNSSSRLLTLSSSIISTTSHSVSSTLSKNMFEKSIQKSIGSLTRSKIARLLAHNGSSSSSEYCSYSHSKLASTSSPSSNSAAALPSSVPVKRYLHVHSTNMSYHHWASFSLILICMSILSTFTTSSMVLCVPLGGSQAGNGVQVARRQTPGVMMMNMPTSKLQGTFQRQQQEEEQQEPPLSQGDIYLPSGGEQGQQAQPVAEQTVEQHSTAIHYPSHYLLNHQQLRQQQQNHAPIQKPASHKDVTRSIIADNTRDVDEDDNDLDDSDEMVDNQIARMPAHLSPAGSSLMKLGSIGLVGEDEPNSIANLMDQGSGAGGSPGQWETVIDPHLYVLTEWNNRNPYQQQQRERRQEEQQRYMFHQQRKRRNSGTGPSLSIVNPLDVLRQRLLLEIARRRMRQSHNQIIANEEILRKIGRR